MDIKVRPATAADKEFVLELNRVNVIFLSPMNEERFFKFLNENDIFNIVEVDGKPAAFLIAMCENNSWYDSENFIWFRDQYDKFLYIDRIVIDENYRRLGIGRILYDEVIKYAVKIGTPMLTVEADVIPFNGPSLDFHHAIGFREVHQLVIRGGEVKVSLMTRDITEEDKAKYQ